MDGFIWDKPFFKVKSVSYVVKAIIETSCYFLFLPVFGNFYQNLLFEKNGLQNFQKSVKDAPCGVYFGKYSVRTFLLRLKTYFLCFIHNFIISGLFEVFIPSFPKLIVSKSLFAIFLWWKVYDFLEPLSFWEERVCLTFSQNVFPFCITIWVVLQHLVEMNLFRIAYSFYTATSLIAFW